MSSEQDEMAETAVDPQKIDSLKAEEKQKLSAAEEAYAARTGSATIPQIEAQEQDTELDEASQGAGMKWMPGVILIGLGLIFLLNNLTGFTLNNWWALFILIPAVASFSRAADSVRTQGEFTRDAWGALAGGLIMTLIASAFLFNLNWGSIWPVFLIIGGIGILLGGMRSWD